MPSGEDGVSLDVLREAVRVRVASSSLRLAAGEIGIAHTTLNGFLNGTQPYGPTLAKLSAWYEQSPAGEVVRLRQENAELRKRLADCEKKLKRAGS